jgi:hypothetical protein
MIPFRFAKCLGERAFIRRGVMAFICDRVVVLLVNPVCLPKSEQHLLAV